MKQLLQRLDTGATTLVQVPVPAASGPTVVVETRATVISAGMSEDFEQAIQCGATHLRVGRLILGERVLLR